MNSRVIPFGDRILVKRKEIGDKLGKEGLILAPDSTKERPTDLAVVVHVPDHTFADKSLLEKSEEIISSLVKKAEDGGSDALISLLRFKDYLKIKSIHEGDEVMIGKYVGTTFHDNQGGEDLTLVNGEDIIGLVVNG